MLGADVVVVECPGLFLGEDDDAAGLMCAERAGALTGFGAAAGELEYSPSEH
jgi:hypothetical protein